MLSADDGTISDDIVRTVWHNRCDEREREDVARVKTNMKNCWENIGRVITSLGIVEDELERSVSLT